MRLRGIAAAACIAASICMGMSGAAFAADEEEDEFSRNGYYIAAHAVYGFQLFDVSQLPSAMTRTPFATDVGDSVGFNIRVGERLRSWIATEVEYEWMNAFPVYRVPGQQIAAYYPDVLTINTRLYWPLWRTQPYLLIGGGIVTYDIQLGPNLTTFNESATGFAFRGGAGLDIYLTRNIVVNIEATALLNTDDFTIIGLPAISDLYYIAVGGGLAYRF